MIKIYSTEDRAKVDLAPIHAGKINMYVCGPTVYASCHVGHARPAVVFDTIRRYLEYSGYAVNFVSNITDIDDKIINRANELGISYRQLTSRYQDEYEQDMAALGVRAPSIRPKATEHIDEMIELISGLEEKGVAYTTPRGVWFDVSKFKDYGHMSGRKADDDNTEHRVEQDGEKRNPQDFALWKFSKPGEPEWDSPWGKGRPGWHIECSAMSGKYCGWQLDIHGGGADLAFPHHENEVAQSEAYSGKQFAKYWMHNGFITVVSEDEDGQEEKMGKSKGNAFWLREAFKVAPAAALRLWILGTHYRAPLQYRSSLLDSAVNSLDRIYNCLEALPEALGGEVVPDAPDFANGAIEEFESAMNDDFNTPQALAAVYGLIGKINSAVKDGAGQSELFVARAVLENLLNVLGLPLARPAAGGSSGDDKAIDLLLALRADARTEKNFAMSDRIRDELTAMGIEINDRGGESTWKRV